ncbi:MAG: ribonuclease HII [Candidatus Cloacimonetes bacterium]|nr:ribonuclease HII [Candidatus Cloacimonadota bacterium]MCF7815014.1 ribonuclease HII [Candidatus Cloacimonadota bacterium]MCF7859932.1 ribonuclease HII [Candidatus Cloacimonadota bacterium]MCF7869265.1 ribonuclease HII [Candidatus Cloacimonadota bacterium]
MNLYENEQHFHQKYKAVAGIDEAGRGPLAGPVVVASVILDWKNGIKDLNDSKKLSAAKREVLYQEIFEKAVCWQIVSIPPKIIDEINILQASLLGMKIASELLSIKPDFCLIDGNKIPKKMKFESKAMIKGDGRFASIAAASILAKVTRDRIMDDLHEKYPQYGFISNKGYPTKKHLQALEKFGVLDCHRKSYKPIQQLKFKF